MKIIRDTPYEPIKKKRGRPKGPSNKRSYSKAYPQKRYIKIKRFVREYLIDLNGTRAYQRCGYGSGNDAVDNVNASKLLNREDVIQLIAEMEEERSKAVNITQEMVLKGLYLLANANVKDISTWDGNSYTLKTFEELTRDQTYIISGMKVMPRQFGGIDLEFKTPSASERHACWIDLGKHLGMFWEGTKDIDPGEMARKIKQSLREQEERTAPKE